MNSIYENKAQEIRSKYEKMNNELSAIKAINHDNISNLGLLKNLFSSQYQDVIQDLTKIIEYISANKENKDNKDNKEKVEEESPASIIRMLDLGWNEHETVEDTLITLGKKTITGSYWCVTSRQVLEGSFLCKILVEEMNTQSPSWWVHNFGIIKKDRKNNDDVYYNDSIVIASNGSLAGRYSGSGDAKKLFEGFWKTGDTLIVKRDNQNNIYFGLNDETDLKLAYENEEGEFRIVLGFGSASKTDSFRMMYLNLE